MKTNIKSIVILLFILFALQNLKSQDISASEEKYPETVLIRLYEPMYYVIPINFASKLITVLPDNTIETKELVSVNLKKDFDPPIETNLIKLRTELQAWQNKGFTVKSMTSATTANSGFLLITTVILTKN